MDHNKCLQKCPAQWKQFLCGETNKTALVKFFLKEWSTNGNAYGQRLRDRSLLITCADACIELSSRNGMSMVRTEGPELFSSQEEADTLCCSMLCMLQIKATAM